jgi:hypothetical protein
MSRARDATPQVQMLGADAGAGQSYFAAPEKLISGNLKQTPPGRSTPAPAAAAAPGFGTAKRGRGASAAPTWEVLPPTLKRFVMHEPDA